MEKPSILFLLILILMFFSVLLHSHPVVAIEHEHWGYTVVPRGGHLFWWFYYTSGFQLQDPSLKWPIILWLEDPGSSGVGIGNFIQIGPKTINDEDRPYTWLSKADLLFVDSPVGTGFSYVDDDTQLVTTDEQAAADLLVLLEKLFVKNLESFKNRPLYIYGEGYGGKIAACLGLQVNDAIMAGKLVIQLGGVILADSWISPAHSVSSLVPILDNFSRFSSKGLKDANSLVDTIKLAVETGRYADAKVEWDKLKDVIAQYSSHVNLDNLISVTSDVPGATTTIYGTERIMRKADSRNYSTKALPFDFSGFMNGQVKQKLGTIIPPHVKWIQRNQKVFDAMSANYMKPRIQEVGLLLTRGVHVSIINGQYDLVCSTKGAETWVANLAGWHGLTTFLDKDRKGWTVLHLGKKKKAAFEKLHEHLAFYWILNAGHYVAFDQPVLLQLIVEQIIKSPPRVAPTVVTTRG